LSYDTTTLLSVIDTDVIVLFVFSILIYYYI
jgi:hypothetical protein